MIQDKFIIEQLKNQRIEMLQWSSQISGLNLIEVLSRKKSAKLKKKQKWEKILYPATKVIN